MRSCTDIPTLRLDVSFQDPREKHDMRGCAPQRRPREEGVFWGCVCVLYGGGYALHAMLDVFGSVCGVFFYRVLSDAD